MIIGGQQHLVDLLGDPLVLLFLYPEAIKASVLGYARPMVHV